MTRPRKRLSVPAFLVLAAVLAVTAASTILARKEVHEQHDQLLDRRGSELAFTLETGLGQVAAEMGVLSNLPLTNEGGPELFAETARSLITGNVRAIGVVDTGAAPLEVIAAVGDLRVGAPVTGPIAAVVGRARGATGFVTGVVQSQGGTRLVYALESDDGARVVVRAVTVDPTTAVDTIRGEVVEDVDVALYASNVADPETLVLATTERPAELDLGDVHRLTVGAQQWLLVVEQRRPLVSTLNRWAPWAVAVAGAMLAVLLTALIEFVKRREAYALALVDTRTLELQDTLAERARLEGEARAASAEALAANRYKSEFLSRMSHELRTPLSAVIGFAQLLELEELSNPQRESVDQIQKGGRHLLALINEILDITRIETGDFTLSPEPVLAEEILRDALDLMRPLIDSAGLTLAEDALARCDVHVFADRQRLKQILLNLLSNAVKYNRMGGTVSVSCTATAGRLRLNVVDSGPGIAPEHLDLLFEPFERLGAEHRNIEGTGIGLALCRRLAEAMGGSVDVETALGRGSTFWVELPLVEAPVERLVRLGPTIEAVAPASTERTHLILYIEDNLANMKLVERVLEQREDIALTAAMQGRLGLELARQHHPALILLDLHLPDVTGDEVLRELRDDPATASIPVVILSADATPGHVQRVLAAGAHSYITKPLDVRELLRTIDELLGYDGL